MAKIKVVGNAAVLISSAKLEDLKTVKKYRPAALKLMGGKDDKEEVFCIGIKSDGTGSINAVGAEFDSKTFDPDGYATITMKIDDSVAPAAVKDWLADKVGASILSLNKLEDTLSGVIEEIESEKDAVLANIVLA